ncbi:purine-nucleoside phosphorylase [Paraliomyxa miuraensis]|uniref:purine-nucleoside phosphorylase n=1 Tax=Paraliomyxa miuraensis TaxID=376150 RepID=UPI0022594017|nr:purine-nucleoside phosphorylase [Paraliomyxa miuraensis]MCX4245263.1 purine-nucleoside phosphorylase [Paraliomyxa miuraensis]
MSEQARKAAAVVAQKVPGFRPRVGITLGSGLGALAERVEDATVVDFGELPGFPRPSVEGHHGRLVLGRLGGQDVACLQGRVHLYEGHPPQAVVPLVRTLRLLGCETYFATNAAGALDPDAVPGQLMLINDHINMQGGNPLVGHNDESFGPRFPAMDGAYDAQHLATLRRVADDLGLPVREGVYLATLGPSFESHAEVRAFGRLGANAVGMSTVPEVIVARHCGLRCAAVSVLTNLAAGLSDEVLSHEQTLHYGQAAAEDLTRLVLGFLAAQGTAG